MQCLILALIYFSISFTFAAMVIPCFLAGYAVECRPATPSVEITDHAFKNPAPPILATASYKSGSCFDFSKPPWNIGPKIGPLSILRFSGGGQINKTFGFL